MKVVWVIKAYWDELSQHVQWVETIRGLEARGHQVTIITGYRARRESFGLARIIFVPSIRKPYLNQVTQTLAASLALWRYLLVERPDVAIVNALGWPAAALQALAARAGLLRTRFVLDVRTVPVDLSGIRGNLLELDFRLGMRVTDRLYDGVTAITPFMAEVLRSRYGVRVPMGQWSSGVSLDRFDPATVPPETIACLREGAGVGADGLLLLYHGTLGAKRGLDNLVRAMALVRRTAPHCVLLLLGGGAATETLRRLIADLGLQGSVVLHPPVPHDAVPAYIAAADFAVMPMPRLVWWRVSSFLKLLEYMAMGKPVVATDMEAYREVLGDAPGAFYAATGQPAALAEAILRAASARASLREIGQGLRGIVAARFQWSQQADRLETMLLRVVGAEPHGTPLSAVKRRS